MSQQPRFRAAASATPSATPGGSGAGGSKRAAPSGGNGGGGGGGGPGASQAAKKRKMTRWNEATMACLCSCLIELADAGKQTDNQGFNGNTARHGVAYELLRRCHSRDCRVL
ncbi:hypothetical protein E4U40_000298 [Claviceps sp. LM458 group G5]|nr:hypothetical protein E4U40_000298 [Claviceps sp. LM458 group G5]